MNKIAKAKDCRLYKLGGNSWQYYVQCACCGHDVNVFISKYPSGRYWVINGNDEKVAWGKTMAVAQRKARERVARGKEMRDAYIEKLRIEFKGK